MNKTYTFTARNAANPAQVVTFTLHDRKLSIEPGPLEGLGALDDDLEVLKSFKGNKPLMIQLFDVAAHVDRDSLRIAAWAHNSDRQWRPITLSLEHVDNLPATRAFVRELNRRKMAALRRELLQRWAIPRLAWFVGGIAVVLSTAVALRIRTN